MTTIRMPCFRAIDLGSSAAWLSGISKALGICLLTILLTACGPAPALQQQDLVGIWTDGHAYMQFDSDGIWTAANSVDGLSTLPLGFGPYRLEGKRLTLDTEAESLFCPGETGIYDVERSGQGEITFTEVEDTCSGRRGKLTLNPFALVSP